MNKLEQECCEVEVTLTLKTLRKDEILGLVRAGLKSVGINPDRVEVSYGEAYQAACLIAPWLEKTEDNLSVYCDGV